MYLIGIIEDDVQLRKTMENYISLQQDMSLVFSCNRIEKWISIRQDAGIVPDCVLLDIGLPGISGLDAISIISSYYPGVKILVISGMEDPLVAWQAMMNGANGFLLKPFRLAEMQKQIEELTNKVNESVAEAAELHKALTESKRDAVFTKVTSDLAQTESEKLRGLVEEVEFESAELFEQKLTVIKNNYFPKNVVETTTITDEQPIVEETSNLVAQYAERIARTKF